MAAFSFGAQPAAQALGVGLQLDGQLGGSDDGHHRQVDRTTELLTTPGLDNLMPRADEPPAPILCALAFEVSGIGCHPQSRTDT